MITQDSGLLQTLESNTNTLKNYFFLYEFKSKKYYINKIIQKYISSPTGKEAALLEINKVIQLITEQEVLMNNLQTPTPNKAYLHALEDITTRLYNYSHLTGNKLKIDFKEYLSFLTTHLKPTPTQIQTITNKFNQNHTNRKNTNKRKYAP